MFACVTVACSSQVESESVHQPIVDEAEVPERALSLQRFALDQTGAKATVLGLGANVSIRPNGSALVEPIPSVDARGRVVTPSWRYATSLEFVGRGVDAPRVAKAKGLRRIEPGVVEISHGPATVRYSHLGKGLKQDIVLREKPAGEGALRIGFATTGGELETGEGFVRVMHEGREVWRWQDLVVFDADGDEVSARMFAANGDLVIEVDDRGAAYPLTVDPLATTSYWTADRTGSPGNENFGFKTKWAGDIDGDGFDDIIVSEPLARLGFVNEGRVSVFLSPNGTPNAVADRSWVGGEENAFLGQGISPAGDVDQDGFADIVVGASAAQLNVDNEGVAYLFRGSATGPGLAAAWSFGSGQGGSSFGSSIDRGDFNCDGRTDLVIGAPLFAVGGSSLAGKVWVFYADGSANFYDPSPFEIEGAISSGRLGSTVTGVGNTNGDTDAGYDCEDLVIASTNVNNGATTAAGRFDYYPGNAAGLANSTASELGTQTNLFFGSAVTALGDVNSDGLDDFALGSQRWDDAAGIDQGRARVYLGNATTGFDSTPQRVLLGGAADDRFGFAVTGGDFNGDGAGDLAVAAPLDDIIARQNEGTVGVWAGEASGIEATAAWATTGPESNSRFGFSINGGGDVDNDGFDDLLVGAPLVDANGVVNAGQVFVFRGGQTCRIGGVTYDAGDPNPQNPCEACDVTNPTSWTNLSDGTACADSAVCGANPTCQAGVCTGTGTVCDDGDPCTIDSCGANDTCQANTAPDGTVCGTDPDPCATVTCQTGSCTTALSLVSCSIGGTCYADGASNPDNPCQVCDATANRTDWTLVSAGTACDDGAFCTVGETCNASGVCGGGTPRDCSGATDACNNNPFCNESAQRCQGRPTNDGGTCDDGDPCTTTDICSAGFCDGTPVDCSNLDDECNLGVCGATGACAASPVPDGTSCGTTAGEACFGGSCEQPIPEANITGPTLVECNETIELDGSGSTDPQSLPLSYQWAQTSPMSPDLIGGADTTGERLTLSNDNQFVDSVTGSFELVVNNGLNDSVAATYVVEFEPCGTLSDDVAMPDMGVADAGGDAGTDAGSVPDAGPSSDAGSETDSGTAEDGGEPSGTDGALSGSGCGCASGGGPLDGSAGLVLLVLAFVGLRRRRR